MRLSLVIPALRSGGAERVLTNMANHWAGQGHAITLLTYDDIGEAPFYRLDPRIHHLDLNLSQKARNPLSSLIFFLNRLACIRRALIASRPQAVVSFMESANVLCLLAVTGTNLPVLVAERNDPAQKDTVSRLWKFLRPLVYPRARGVIAQTERMAGYFRPGLNGKLEVIPNPVMRPPGQGREGEEVAVGDHTVVSLGRLDAQKGFDLLIRSFAQARTKHPGWSLAIFGVGKEQESLEAQARALGLQEVVRFPGRVKDAYAVLKKAGLYVSSSRYEGFPNALCEAMACGLPVIATDCPTGPREIITDGVDGLLVPNGDVNALARAMQQAMGDPALRRRLGARAAAITERFGIDAVMRRWETVLRERCGVSAFLPGGN